MSKRDFEELERKLEKSQGGLAQTDLQVNALKESLKAQQSAHDTQGLKVKELSETLYKIDNVQIPTLTTRLGQMSSKEELAAVKREQEEQVTTEKISSQILEPTSILDKYCTPSNTHTFECSIYS